MTRLLAVLVSLGLSVSAFAGEEKLAHSRIESVGLFKNGLAVVHRTLTIDGPGTYRLEDVPEPIHGTFWIESAVNVVARLTRHTVGGLRRQVPHSSFQEELGGREVVIHFGAQGIPPVTGTVLDLQLPADPVSRNRDSGRPLPGPTLVLSNETGRCYVDPTKIAYLQTKEAGQTGSHSKPVMLLTVADAQAKKATISITYLAKGMAWAPSYRIDVSDAKSLAVRQNAIIKNELEGIEKAQVYLISGFPSVQFANVTSPLSLGTTWNQFFEQLNRRFPEGQASARYALTQQAVSYNTVRPDGGMDLSAMPTGEGVDLHYQDIGRLTLAQGDSLAMDTASARAAYEPVVEWLVPDTRHADGRYVMEQERESHPDKYKDAAWDALRFRNPLPFPMTTAPAMVVAQGRFNGQRLSYWVNPGEETTLHVTKALSIRTRNVEHEVDSSRELVNLGGVQYRKSTVQGELRANNHRHQSVTLVIRRRFSGELLSADQSPKQTLQEEGAYSVNPRNELLWTLSLKAGEEVTLTYRYTVLTRH